VSNLADYLPIFIYSLAVLGFAGVSLIAPHVVAPRKSTPVKDMPYESGMDPIGDARQPLDIKFYLIAILFIVFDVELLFIYPWATVVMSFNKATEAVPTEARAGLLLVMISLLISLAIGYVYAWRKGVFQWRNK
jgi:NADH-quinone oxidoreductase subunit A